jgi:hypothetical protein
MVPDEVIEERRQSVLGSGTLVTFHHAMSRKKALDRRCVRNIESEPRQLPSPSYLLMNFKKPAGIDMHGSKRIGLADDIDSMGLAGMRDAKSSGSDHTSTLPPLPGPFAFQHHVELIGIVEMNWKGIRLDLCSDLEFDPGNGSRAPESKSRPGPPARWAARLFS